MTGMVQKQSMSDGPGNDLKDDLEAGEEAQDDVVFSSPGKVR